MVIVEIRVCPNKKHRRALLDAQGRITLELKSEAKDGKANKELVAYLAQLLRMPQACITLHKGHTSRVKRIAIDSDMTRELLLEALNITSVQLTIGTIR